MNVNHGSAIKGTAHINLFVYSFPTTTCLKDTFSSLHAILWILHDFEQIRFNKLKESLNLLIRSEFIFPEYMSV